MDDKEMPLSSDESDADFVPKEECSSNSDSDISDKSSGTEEKNIKGQKRKKSLKLKGKRVKKEEKEETEDDDQGAKKKIDIDALWADFKKDVSNNECKKPSLSTNETSESDIMNKNSQSSQSSDKSKLETRRGHIPPKFPIKNKPGGLSKVFEQIGKKVKMSTLEKSQLDWNNFKKSEGIEEEIKLYNKGKDGYLEKQDFLQRTDLRQFEIEKDLRSSRRKF